MNQFPKLNFIGYTIGDKEKFLEIVSGARFYLAKHQVEDTNRGWDDQEGKDTYICHTITRYYTINKIDGEWGRDLHHLINEALNCQPFGVAFEYANSFDEQAARLAWMDSICKQLEEEIGY